MITIKAIAIYYVVTVRLRTSYTQRSGIKAMKLYTQPLDSGWAHRVILIGLKLDSKQPMVCVQPRHESIVFTSCAYIAHI